MVFLSMISIIYHDDDASIFKLFFLGTPCHALHYALKIATINIGQFIKNLNVVIQQSTNCSAELEMLMCHYYIFNKLVYTNN